MHAADINSSANGVWSNASIWTGGVVPGNGDYVIIKHNVTIDQNVGTSGVGNGINRISINGVGNVAGAQLLFDGVTNRTIYFAGNGTNATGVGTVANPGNGSNYGGIAIGIGTLNLTGNPNAIISLQPADPTGYFYITHTFTMLGATNFGPNVYLKYCYAKNLGQNVNSYNGFYFEFQNSGSNPSTVDVENCEFENPYYVLYMGLLDTKRHQVTYINNTIWNSRAVYTLENPTSTNMWNNSIIQNNTEYNSSYLSSSGYMFHSLGEMANASFIGNAIYGYPRKRGLARVDGVGVFNGSGNFSGNLYVTDQHNISEGAVGLWLATDGGMNVSNNIVVNSYQGINVGGTGGSNNSQWLVSYNFLSNSNDTNGQGALFQTKGVMNGSYNVIKVTVGTNAQSIGYFTYDIANTNATTTIADHNTLVGPLGALVDGMSFGDGSFGIINSKARANVIVNWGTGIRDFAPDNDYVRDSPYNAGVYNNLVYNNSVNYVQLNNTGFNNGSLQHPNSFYNDLTVDPQFVDPTRNVTGYDLSQGGPGTMYNVITQLAKRSGQRGTFDTDYNIEPMRQWIFAGYAPTNAALDGTAYDGGDIGAVDFSSPTAPTFNTTLPNNATVYISEPSNQVFNYTLNYNGTSSSVWRLNGTTVATNTTAYTFSGNYTSAGTWLVNVTVSTADGNISNQWTLVVANTSINFSSVFPNNATVYISEPSNQLFNYSLNIPAALVSTTWRLNGTTVGTGSSYTFAGNYTSAGNWVVNLTVVTLDGTLNNVWNLVVAQTLANVTFATTTPTSPYIAAGNTTTNLSFTLNNPDSVNYTVVWSNSTTANITSCYNNSYCVVNNYDNLTQYFNVSVFPTAQPTITNQWVKNPPSPPSPSGCGETGQSGFSAYIGVFIAIAITLGVIGNMIGAEMAYYIASAVGLAVIGLFLAILPVVLGCI